MPSDIHTIRLRHPWQCEPSEVGTRWLRSFNWPAGLTPRELARLVVEGLPASAAVELNGMRLAATADEQFDITALLGPTNRLAIEVSDPAAANNGDCPFDVRLEIVEG